MGSIIVKRGVLMKKVCIILNYGNDSPPFLSNLCKQLDKEFERVFLISKETDQEKKKKVLCFLKTCFMSIGNIFILLRDKRINAKSVLDILKLNYAAQRLINSSKGIIKEYNPEEISVLAVWFWSEALAAAKLKKNYQEIRTVSLAHSFEIDQVKNKVYDLGYLALKHKYLDQIVFISQNMMNIYIQNIKRSIDLNNIQVLYLGCNKKYCHEYKNEEEEMFRIVSCSRVAREKRVFLILEALKLLKNIRIEWTHFGDGALMSDLRRQSSLAVSDNLKINLMGEVSNDEIQKSYAEKNYTLFLNVSTSEGIPVAIMEAMSYGIPVMATNVGGNNEIVSNDTGVLLPKDINAQILANELLNFANISVEKHKKMKQRAECVWKKKFDAEKNMKKIVDLLQ